MSGRDNEIYRVVILGHGLVHSYFLFFDFSDSTLYTLIDR